MLRLVGANSQRNEEEYHSDYINAMAHLGETINGYTVASKKSTSGQSYWFFASRGDDTSSYFLKAFLTPKEPTKESLGDKKYKKEMQKRFDTFLEHQNKLVTLTSGKSDHLLSPIEQFIHKGTLFKVFDKHTENTISAKKISKHNAIDKINILECISDALFSLHSLEIVHSDIKLENILFSKERKINSPLLIDYDGAFFCGRANEIEDIFFDQPYASPEMIQYAKDKKTDELTKATDIFSLGVLFHEIWYGEKPSVGSTYTSCGHSVLDGKQPNLKRGHSISELISSMLHVKYEKRPSIDNIIESLQELRSKIEKSKLHISLSFIKKLIPKGILKVNLTERQKASSDNIKSVSKKVRMLGEGGKLKTTIKK